jgi:hypothetical protein
MDVHKNRRIREGSVMKADLDDSRSRVKNRHDPFPRSRVEKIYWSLNQIENKKTFALRFTTQSIVDSEG